MSKKLEILYQSKDKFVKSLKEELKTVMGV